MAKKTEGLHAAVTDVDDELATKAQRVNREVVLAVESVMAEKWRWHVAPTSYCAMGSVVLAPGMRATLALPAPRPCYPVGIVAPLCGVHIETRVAVPERFDDTDVWFEPEPICGWILGATLMVEKGVALTSADVKRGAPLLVEARNLGPLEQGIHPFLLLADRLPSDFD